MTLTDWLGPQEWQAVRLSLRVAGVAMLASLPFAVTVAWLLARRRFPGHGLLSGPPIFSFFFFSFFRGLRAPFLYRLI